MFKTGSLLHGLYSWDQGLHSGVGVALGMSPGRWWRHFYRLIESVGPSLFLDGLGIVAPYQLKMPCFYGVVLVLIFRPTGILESVWP